MSRFQTNRLGHTTVSKTDKAWNQLAPEPPARINELKGTDIDCNHSQKH